MSRVSSFPGDEQPMVTSRIGAVVNVRAPAGNSGSRGCNYYRKALLAGVLFFFCETLFKLLEPPHLGPVHLVKKSFLLGLLLDLHMQLVY